jgi:hypothetical protein
MQATVEYLNDVQFGVAVRGHHLVCDQPLENKGSDTGISPPEFLLVSRLLANGLTW